MADRHPCASPVRPVEVIIEDIAREAGTLALTHFRSLAGLPVEKKGHLHLVTEADRQVEALLIARLNQAYPDEGVFGEEGGEIPGTSGRIWVIEPIDGTSISCAAARTGRSRSSFTRAGDPSSG